MNNSSLLTLIPYIIASSAGLITFCCIIFLYARHRSKIYLYLVLLLFSMLSKLLYSIIKIYFNAFTPNNDFILEIFKIIKALGVSVLLFVLPAFISHIMLVKMNKSRTITFAAVSLIPFLFHIFEHLITDIPYSYLIKNTIFITVIFYCITSVIINLRNMADKRQRKIIITFLILAIVFFPLLITDIILGITSIQLPVYFILVNILGVIFSFFYLVPPSVIDKEEIIDFLQKKYNITEREKEIIALVKTGHSNNEISEITSITISTVEKHINSIYRKLNIKKRVQLVNLLQSGMQ